MKNGNNSVRKQAVLSAISGGIAALLVMGFFLSAGIIGGSGDEEENFWNGLFESISDVSRENPDIPVSADNASIQEDLIVNAVKKAQPAVVSVIITKNVPILEQYYDDSVSSPFDDFFGPGSGFDFRVPQYREKGTEKKEVGGGSGFVVSSDGYIITNNHVVNEKDAEYTIFTNDGKKYPAKVVAGDTLNDIAVLKIQAKDLPYLTFGDSEKILVGQTAIAIGNPLLEFENSVSVGVVSGLSRSIVAGGGGGQSEQLDGVIQTDAAINPGNSGGPLLNLKGEVIGVNVAVASAENIGFSLPSNLVKKTFESVKENGKIVRPYLGVRYIQINEQIKEVNKLSVDYGVLVARGKNEGELAVLPGSPADKAGLVENDIILEVDGKKLDKDSSLARIVAGKNVGDTIKLKVMSKGEEKEISVKLTEMKE